MQFGLIWALFFYAYVLSTFAPPQIWTLCTQAQKQMDYGPGACDSKHKNHGPCMPRMLDSWADSESVKIWSISRYCPAENVFQPCRNGAQKGTQITNGANMGPKSPCTGQPRKRSARYIGFLSTFLTKMKPEGANGGPKMNQGSPREANMGPKSPCTGRRFQVRVSSRSHKT